MSQILTRALLAAAIVGCATLAGCVSSGDEHAAAKSPTARQPAATTGQRTAGEVSDDGVMTAKVKAKLVDDPTTKAYQIDVDTFKGTVQLNGVVDSAEARARATELAKEVGGVKDVKNSLQVRKSDG